jgi:hypothetical protein
VYPFIAALDFGDRILMRKHLLTLKERIEANVARRAETL